MSTQSFAELGVSSAVVGALAAQGVTRPFAIQREVIGDALAGRDVLAKSPTGSGKTLAFGIPLVDRIQPNDPRPSALVLAPTRELAVQIVDDLSGIAHAKNGRDWAEDFFAKCGRFFRDIHQHRRFVEKPGPRDAIAAGQ